MSEASTAPASSLRPSPRLSARPPLRLCLAAAEAAPWAKRGGLGDVTAALGAHLAAAGHDARLFLPLYGAIDRVAAGLRMVPQARGVEVALGPRSFPVSAWTLPPAEGGDGEGGDGEGGDGEGDPARPTVYFLDCPELFGGPSVYEGEGRDALRFSLFGRAVVEVCRRLDWTPHVVHLHDWHAAPLLLHLRCAGGPLAAVPTLLTLHNVGYQGVVEAERVEELGLADCTALLPGDDLAAGRLNLLRAALPHADRVSTVSPTHAREITTPEGGAGLHGTLAALARPPVGILNGIDVDVWNPATDPHLPATYTADDLRGKVVCRRELAAETGLDYEPAAPVAGIVSRLAWQKGFDLTFEPLPEALRGSDLRLVVLGTGEEELETFFAGLAQGFPGRVAFVRDFSEPLAHRIEAGSDLFLMPSRYEPCGLNQMYSQRYGTLPLVRATGGLADTVEPWVQGGAETAGTGFVFEHFTAAGFRWALGEALRAWRRRKGWRAAMRRAMGRDFSWRRAGERYVELYRELAGGAGETAP